MAVERFNLLLCEGKTLLPLRLKNLDICISSCVGTYVEILHFIYLFCGKCEEIMFPLHWEEQEDYF